MPVCATNRPDFDSAGEANWSRRASPAKNVRASGDSGALPASNPHDEPIVDRLRYSFRVTSREMMNALPLRPASLVVAASDGPGG